MVNIIPPTNFIEEVKKWGVKSGSLHRVRAMQKGNIYYFRFHIPSSGEIIETRIDREQYQNFAFMELAPLITPSIWRDEVIKINIQNATPPNTSDYIGTDIQSEGNSK